MKLFNKLSFLNSDSYDPALEHEITEVLWYGTVRVAAFGAVLATILGALLFWDTQVALQNAKESSAVAATIRREQLNETIGTINQRAVQYEFLQGEGISTENPAR